MEENLDNNFEKDAPVILTDKEKNEILMGIDPKLLQQSVYNKKRRNYTKRTKSEGALQYDQNSAVTDSSVDNTSTKKAQNSETVNIQNHLTAALAVVDNLHPGTLSRSPSLRRISVKPDEPTIRSFMKKKISEPAAPKLVFTFTNEDETDMGGTDEDSPLGLRKNYSNPTFSPYQSLGIDHLLDNSDTVSVRSFQNQSLGVQHLIDKMERIELFPFTLIGSTELVVV